MKKFKLLLLAVIMSFGMFSKADEGMWLPMLIERLNYVDMQKMGLQLTAEEIYSVNNSSLKDAIIQFGNGCTGEIISEKGLVLTNHHCGYGKIQAHSTVEHDYLTDGFWAYDMKDELANPGLIAKFLIRMEDVTGKVLGDINNEMSDNERKKKIAEIIQSIEKEAVEGTNYEAKVKSFFEGNEYYLFVYETYSDIRLVGAPPSSIGKYGADTDNWMWPRHNADFCIFRIYSGPDGKPAGYSTENIPLKPKHYLPISLDGVKKDDFTMILGYPGGTDRYLTSYGINLKLDEELPTRIAIREKKLGIMREDMDTDPEIRIQYASKYAQTSNYWKNFIGMSKGLKRLKVADKKRETEQGFEAWVEQFPSRKETYGLVISDIASAYETLYKYNKATYYFIEGIWLGPDVFKYSRDFEKLVMLMKADNPDNEKIEKVKMAFAEKSAKFFKDYNAATDKKLMAAMLDMYSNNVPKGQQPKWLTDINKKYKGNFVKFTDVVFKKSIFVSEEKIKAFLANPSAKVIEKDLVYQGLQAFLAQYRKNLKELAPVNNKLDAARHLFIKGLREMNPDINYYPDANFTMRLTYGKVLDYKAADAVYYNYSTTLDGVMEKEDPNNWEFVVPSKLKELHMSKDYGVYGENGVMKVCFISNNDITGGNSGSPVINGKGQLVGLAFDGNWEAMSGDIAFEPELQRTINVDIRYVLFIIDKFAGAKNIIDELELVRNSEPAEAVDHKIHDAPVVTE